MLLELTSFSFLMYFYIILRSDEKAILLVFITIPLLSECMKLTEILDLIFLNCLLILAMCVFDYTITLSTLFDPIYITICFLERCLVVMFIFCLPF